MLEKVWTSQADFEAGTLNGIWVPEGLNRLEPKRLALSGTGVWTFDGGPGRKFNWQSFGYTTPNRNIYYRDDFRDQSIADWVLEGGTWDALSYYLKGTGNVVWNQNGMRIGSTSWAGTEILLKILVKNDGDCQIWVRSDAGRDNGYLWKMASSYVSWARILNDTIAESYQYDGEGIIADTWHWWRIQCYTSGSNVVFRERRWQVGNEEPEIWNHTKTFTGIFRSAGCIAVGTHYFAAGDKDYFDNFLVSRKEGIPSPANCSVSFKFCASSNGSSWGSEYTDITKVPNSRFIKIEATLSRTSLLSAMPTVEDMTLGYKLLSQPIFI